MRVSVTVGSVVPTSTMGTSSFSVTRSRDVAVLPIHAAEHGPAVFVKEHFHQFGGRRSPQSRLVVNLQCVRLAFISAAGVGLLDGQLRAVQLRNAENGFGIVLDGAHEADGDFAQLGGIAVRAQVSRAVVFEGVFAHEPVVVGLGEAAVGHGLIRHVGVAALRLDRFIPLDDGVFGGFVRSLYCWAATGMATASRRSADKKWSFHSSYLVPRNPWSAVAAATAFLCPAPLPFLYEPRSEGGSCCYRTVRLK